MQQIIVWSILQCMRMLMNVNGKFNELLIILGNQGVDPIKKRMVTSAHRKHTPCNKCIYLQVGRCDRAL